MSIKKFESNREEIGNRLKIARKAKGISQHEIAEKIDIVQGHISSIENGRYPLIKSVSLALEYLYKINSNWLLTGEGEMFLNAPGANQEKDVASSFTSQLCEKCGQPYNMAPLLESKEEQVGMLKKENVRLEKEKDELRRSLAVVEQIKIQKVG